MHMLLFIQTCVLTDVENLVNWIINKWHNNMPRH